MTKTAKCQGEYNLLDPICTKCGEHVVRHHPVAIRGFKNQDYENKNEQPVPDVRESDGEPPANPADGRDEAAKEYYRKSNDIYAAPAFKAGWDARDEQLLKLHGDGAMADVIRLQQEVKRLRGLLDKALEENRYYRSLVKDDEILEDENARLREALQDYASGNVAGAGTALEALKARGGE